MTTVNRILVHAGCRWHRDRDLHDAIAEVAKWGSNPSFFICLNAEPVRKLPEADPHVIAELQRFLGALYGSTIIEVVDRGEGVTT